MKRFLILSFLILLAACEKDDPPATEKSAPVVEEPTAVEPPAWAGRISVDSGFPCAVEQVLQQSCRRCHWEPQENEAPFALRTWDDTQAMRSGKPIHVLMLQMVEADLMPPLDALVEPDVEPLTAEQKEILVRWLKQGAKKSTEKCSP